MFRIKTAVYFILPFWIGINCYSQQPVLSVQRFDYIWDAYLIGSDGAGKKRVIIPSQEVARQSMANSFSRVLQQRWNVKVPEMVLSVKSLSAFSTSPRFNTKLKYRQPGTWYLFLQIFDMGTPFQNLYENDSRATALELKCKLISSDNDSVILDRRLSVQILKDSVPANQVVLSRLPAYPDYFIKSFDSIASWLFQPESESQKTFRLKPACVFSPALTTQEPVAQLNFNSDREYIYHLTSPSFKFHMTGPHYEKTKTLRNTGGNIAGGVLTIFTGVGTNKSKVKEITADFPFEENDSAYHCLIHFTEKETAEREREKTKNPDGSKSYSVNSGSYSFAGRFIDPGFVHAIIFGQDTLATFRINYKNDANVQKKYTRFWDGSDSATITNLPDDWKNNSEIVSVLLSGEISNQPFSMKNADNNIAKEFYVGEQLVLIMYGQRFPKTATLFQPVTDLQLKIFTMLSSLPYDYFNYGAY